MLSTLAATLLALPFLTLATPSGLLERDGVYKGVYVCDTPGWKPPCQYYPAYSGTCYNRPGISSIGPDKGTLCSLYELPNCQLNDNAAHLAGAWDGIAFPGLKDWRHDINARAVIASDAKSFRCR